MAALHLLKKNVSADETKVTDAEKIILTNNIMVKFSQSNLIKKSPT